MKRMHHYAFASHLSNVPRNSEANLFASELEGVFDFGQTSTKSSSPPFDVDEVYMSLSRYEFPPHNYNVNQDIRPNKYSYSNDLLLNERILGGNLDDIGLPTQPLPFNPNHDQHNVPSYPHYANMKQFGQQQQASSGNCSGSHNVVSSSKTRIRWTQDLHDRFVDCVNRLGGPYKARPKAILQMMDTEGVTIFHVKSHLQKYRNMKYEPESVEGRWEKKSNSEKTVKIDIETGVQIKEALQLQLDVQMRLHEQLEIQRSLQLRIEEQGKKLKMMLDQQQQQDSSSKSTVEDPDSMMREGSDDNGFPIKTD